MAPPTQLATAPAAHAGARLHGPAAPLEAQVDARLDARFDAVEALIRQWDEPAAPTVDLPRRKRQGNSSRRAVAAAVRRALWKLAADPNTVAMIQEAITAEPVPFRADCPIRYDDVLQLLRAQSGFRPLPLRPRHPVGRAIGVVDQRLGRLVLVVEAAPDDTARFRIPTTRSARLEALLHEELGTAFSITGS